MQEYVNEHTHENYIVSNVSMKEAFELKRQGVVFYDNTKLVAMNTCPTFGVLRYAKHKTEINVTGRVTAIECGKACHEFFAALRMWTLLKQPTAQVTEYGIQLFGEERWNNMLATPRDGDDRSNAISFALEALHTSGYYDNPNDRRRTMANMEVACITYADRYLMSDLPVLVRDSFIGVEVPFVVKIVRRDAILERAHYYCGRVDGVHEYGGSIITAENKTAGRIDENWRNTFHTSSQITGYNIALSAILELDISDSLVLGIQIPPPARDIYAGVSFEPVRRTLDDKLRWFEWFFHSIEAYELYRDPITAPRYTHSCNRYFKTCQFLPFCTMTRQEQQEMLESMRVEEWSPLDHLNVKSDEEDKE